MDAALLNSLWQIILIDILLSGDNALVIALACRNLPAHQRRVGILLGTGAAIGLRILFAIIISYLLKVPLLQVVGGIMLLWIAVKLATEDAGEHDIEAKSNLWGVVQTIAIADAVMSLDNVLAVSAAAHGNIWLFAFGVIFSIPLIIFGSEIILKLLNRYPVIVWFGAALLGWIAGAMIVKDKVVVNFLQGINAAWVTMGKSGVLEATKTVEYAYTLLGVLIVVGAAYFLKKNKSA